MNIHKELSDLKLRVEELEALVGKSITKVSEPNKPAPSPSPSPSASASAPAANKPKKVSGPSPTPTTSG